MKNRGIILRVGFAFALCAQLLLPVSVRAVGMPELQITQLNITGDEYITIQNSGTTAVDLSQYWLGYIGSDTATAVPGQQLSAQILQPGETMMLNNGAAETCGAVAIDNLSFSLSNTAGTLALWRLDAPVGSSAAFSFLGSTSWGKGATSNSYLKIADEANVAKFNSTNPSAAWLKNASSWQVGDMQRCQFTPVVSATVTQPPVNVSWPVSTETPPFTVLPAASVSSGSGTSSTSGSIPAADIGLKALQLSEILPNPASPQTDADDEFIELYNPNDKPFDVSGFKLQIASTTSATTHNYTIPAGTMIPAKGFKAFMSADSNLSLSNSGGEVWFVDPLDHTVTSSGVYGTAGEGQSWINTNGTWQWTAVPTPNAPNKLSKPAAKTTAAKKKSATVNGRSIAGLKNTSAGKVAGASTASAYDAAAQAVPLHPGTLAAVICLALLYLAYEYRRDVANRIRQFRDNRAARP